MEKVRHLFLAILLDTMIGRLDKADFSEASMLCQDMVLKVQGAGELGGWADMTTICKKVVDVAQYIGTDQGGHEVVLSMPFTSKSGFGSAHNSYPQLHVKFFAKLSEVCRQAFIL